MRIRAHMPIDLRANLRYILPSLAGLIAAIVALALWATRLEPVLRAAVNDFLRQQTLSLIRDSKEEELSINLGRFDFSLGRGRLVIDSVSVVYDDSTAERVQRLRAASARVTLTGIRIPEIIFRRRVVLSGVRIVSPVVYRQESRPAADSAPVTRAKKRETAVRPPNVDRAYTLQSLDSLLYGTVAEWLPNNLEGTRIELVAVDGADIISVTGAPGREKRTSIEKLVVELKGIGLDSSKQRVFREAWISSPRFTMASGHDPAFVEASGIAFRASPTDTAVAVDSVAVVVGDFNVLRGYKLERSYPKKSLTMERLTITPDLPDAEFFRRIRRRATRVKLEAREIAFIDMLSGSTLQQATTARRLDIGYLDIDAATDKRYAPGSGGPPSMPPQALARLPWVVDIDTVLLRNGQVKYTEIQKTGDPSHISFTKVNARVTGVVNRDPKRPLDIQASSTINGSGNLVAHMTMPIDSSRFELDASGTWTGMPLANLNTFVIASDGVRITQGAAAHTTFRFRIANGVSRGTLSPTFHDLKVELVSKETGKANLGNKLKSFVARTFFVRNSNMPGEKKYVAGYPINYRIKPKDTFFGILWRSVRSGVLVAMKK